MQTQGTLEPVWGSEVVASYKLQSPLLDPYRPLLIQSQNQDNQQTLVQKNTLPLKGTVYYLRATVELSRSISSNTQLSERRSECCLSTLQHVSSQSDL